MKLKIKDLKFYQLDNKDIYICKNSKISTSKFEFIIDFFDYYRMQEVINVILDNVKEFSSPLDITFENIYKDVDDHSFVKIISHYIQEQWMETLSNNNLDEVKEFIKLLDNLSVYFEKYKITIDTILNNGGTIASKEYQTNEIIKSSLSAPLSVMFEKIENQIIPCYYPKNLDELFYILINLLLVNKPNIKVCKSCGKFFIPTRLSQEYCTRIYLDTGKTCKEIGAMLSYNERNKDNEANKVYSKYYKKYYARVKVNTLTQKRFDNWIKQAKQARIQCENNQISLDEFINILENI